MHKVPFFIDISILPEKKTPKLFDYFHKRKAAELEFSSTSCTTSSCYEIGDKFIGFFLLLLPQSELRLNTLQCRQYNIVARFIKQSPFSTSTILQSSVLLIIFIVCNPSNSQHALLLIFTRLNSPSLS